MFNWLRSLFGLHVCREFTQWETVRLIADGIPVDPSGRQIGPTVRTVRHVKRRYCLDCGNGQCESIATTDIPPIR